MWLTSILQAADALKAEKKPEAWVGCYFKLEILNLRVRFRWEIPEIKGVVGMYEVQGFRISVVLFLGGFP